MGGTKGTIGEAKGSDSTAEFTLGSLHIVAFASVYAPKRTGKRVPTTVPRSVGHRALHCPAMIK